MNLLWEFQNSHNGPTSNEQANHNSPPPPQQQQQCQPPTPPPCQVVNPYNRNNNTNQNSVQQRVQNPYTCRQNTTPPPSNANVATQNIHARMAEIINNRVEQATNARLADYFNNLNQQFQEGEEGMHNTEQETGFDHGTKEEAGVNQVEIENNTVFEGYSLDSPQFTSNFLNIISTAQYLPNAKSQTHPKLPSSLFKVILDSGCTDTMSAHKDLFDNITYFCKGSTLPPNNPHVLLGDGQTALPIQGYSTMRMQLCGKILKLYAYYVPQLGDITLISSKQHSQYQGNYIHKENNTTLLAFPSFLISLATNNKIHAIVTKPTKTSNDYNKTKSILTTK